MTVVVTCARTFLFFTFFGVIFKGASKVSIGFPGFGFAIGQENLHDRTILSTNHIQD